MDKSFINEARKYLIAYLAGKSCEYETVHSWRKDSNFVILHSFRVEAYALRIMENEKGKLSEEEETIVQAAAILHDIGRFVQREDHALVGKNIVENWLKNNPHLEGITGDRERLLKLIQKHSDKDSENADYACAVLQDADILDEIGAMSIFMAASWLDRQSPFFFNELLERLETFEIGYCEKQMKRLKTDAARKILEQKTRFIEDFNLHLAGELKGTEEFYRLIKE